MGKRQTEGMKTILKNKMSIYLDDSTWGMLEEMSEISERSKNNLIKFLIIKEYKRARK